MLEKSITGPEFQFIDPRKLETSLDRHVDKAMDSCITINSYSDAPNKSRARKLIKRNLEGGNYRNQREGSII